MIRHSKVDGAPPSSDQSKIDSTAWNDNHIITDPAAVGAAIGVYVVSGDPNGTRPALRGSLARDTALGQLWLNVSGTATGDIGTTWTPLVRADGGTTPTRRLIGLLGNSNFNSQGVTTDGASRQNAVFTPDLDVVLDKIFGTSSSEPVPLVDMGRGPLRIANVSSFPGYGPELSFGREILGLLNGFSTTPSQPWLVCDSISGARLKDALPASTYGTATPQFGGLNWYGAFKARLRAAEVACGEELSLLISDLGPNDGANTTDANNVAANWGTFWTQFSSDFPRAQLILLQMNAAADAAFNPTLVRPQMLLASQQIAGCRLVIADVLPLNSDALHYGARRIWTIGGWFAAAARDVLGLKPRTTTIPAFLGYGEPEYHPVSGSSTTLKPQAYPLTQAGQMQLILAGSMKNSGTYVTIPSPTVPASGWTSLGNTTQTYSGQTQGVALFSRPTSQADIDGNDHLPPGAQIVLSNDENYCKLFTLFGTGALALDGSVTTFKATSFSSSAFTAAGVTTTKDNALVVVAFVTQGGGLSPTEQFTITNSNVTGLTIVTDEPYALNTGNFGVLVVATCTMETAGATGNFTITPSTGFNAAPCGFVTAFGAA